MNAEMINLYTVGGVGAFGLVVWMVQYTLKHTIPKLVDDFKEALTSQQDIFAEQLREQRSFCRNERCHECERHMDALDRMRESIDDLKSEAKA